MAAAAASRAGTLQWQRQQRGRRRSLTTAAAAPAAAGEGRSVAVVGGGVIGLTSALRIKQALPAAEVRVVAEAFEGTTSHGAGGLWKPYTLGNTPAGLVNRWGAATLAHYLQLYQSPAAPEAGTVLTSAIQLWSAPLPDPEWASVVPHFRRLTSRELAVYDVEGTHRHGWFYTTVITEGRLYMGWLAAQLEGAGVGREERRLGSLAELGGSADVVVNCAGLGARELVGDASVHPVRGHVLRVRAPWVRHYLNCEYPPGDALPGDCYIIPNSDTVVLGGTKGAPGDYDVQPRPADRAAILDRARRALPSLAAAEVVGEWVGLRPGRPSVRLELEPGGGGGPPVVHNYGHGGAGLTLAWGCAGDAAYLVVGALGGKPW